MVVATLETLRVRLGDRFPEVRPSAVDEPGRQIAELALRSVEHDQRRRTGVLVLELREARVGVELSNLDVDHPVHGVWLGLRRDITELLEPSRLELGPGDLLLLQTDGVWETANDEGLLDYPKIEACVAAHATAGPQAVVDAVLELARGWCEFPEDDRTVVAVRLDP